MKQDNDRDNNSTVWQSGIRYTEDRNKSKTSRIIAVTAIALMAAVIGGIVGSSFIDKKYEEKMSYYDKEIDKLNKQKGDFLNGDIASIAEKVGPAIVGISKTPSNWIDEALEGSLGSGVIFDKKGYIVTNQHIINGLSDITVILAGEKRVKAKLVAEDLKSDIAILKIDQENLTAVKFGNSNDIKTGETVIGMGNPLGEEFSGCLTLGVIGATNKVIKVDDRLFKIFQTDMQFTNGNSGGAVLDSSGQVIGIINKKLTTAEGGSFIMPINEAKEVIEALMKYGKVETTFLGVRNILIDEERSKKYNVPIGLGVTEVVKGTTAEAYGIKKGDIILSIDNGRIKKMKDITDLLEGKKSGDKVKIQIYRDGKEITINAVLMNKQY